MKPPVTVPRTPCLCIALRRAAQKVTEWYDEALKPAGITVNQYSLLANIDRMEGCGTGELAQRVKLEKSTLVRTLHPLLRDGLILDNAPATSRRRQLFVSPRGKDVLKKAFPLWELAQKKIVLALGENHAALMDIFTRLGEE